MSNIPIEEKEAKSREWVVEISLLLQPGKIKNIVKIKVNEIKERAITYMVRMYAEVLKKDIGGRGVLVSNGRNPLTRRDLGDRMEIS